MDNNWNGTMNHKKVVHVFFILSFLLSLSACNNSLIKEKDVPQQDMFEIEALANTAYENNDWVESEKHYTVLVKNIPENATHWFRLGNIYARTQRPDAAVSAYREALIRDPKYSKAWYNMGVLQLRQAVNSFNELQIYVDKHDPLYDKSQKLFEDTMNILRGNENKSE
jgi:cytochrome c-type biogenesis protein CcmH/NrfG